MNFREAALLLFSDDATLAAHPEADRLRQAARPRQTLTELLTRELVAREGERLNLSSPPADDGRPLSAIEYFRRMENLEVLDDRLDRLAGLSSVWRTLVDLPARSVAALVERIGLDLISATAQSVSRARLDAWLARLGEPLASRVVRRLADLPPTDWPKDAAARLKQSVHDLSLRFTGERLANETGTWAIGSLYRALPAGTRQSAARLCRSSLTFLLDAPSMIGPPDDVCRVCIERVVRRRLAMLRDRSLWGGPT